MDDADFAALVNLYDRFANALDFDSDDARAAEGEFFLVLDQMFQGERALRPGLEYGSFRHATVLRCKRRIAKGE